MKLHKDSHLDHGLTKAQVSYVLDLFKDKDAFFIATIELPDELGTTLCGLYGPVMGDHPIADARTMRRGQRPYGSRVVDLPMRKDRRVTVIAGPHDGLPCVLYTAFGGPISPREPGDVRREMEALHEQRAGLHDMSDEYKAIQSKVIALREKRAESDSFWAEHALSSSELPAPQ
jgi:hypothetical protein